MLRYTRGRGATVGGGRWSEQGQLFTPLPSSLHRTRWTTCDSPRTSPPSLLCGRWPLLRAVGLLLCPSLTCQTHLHSVTQRCLRAAPHTARTAGEACAFDEQPQPSAKWPFPPPPPQLFFACPTSPSRQPLHTHNHHHHPHHSTRTTTRLPSSSCHGGAFVQARVTADPECAADARSNAPDDDTAAVTPSHFHLRHTLHPLSPHLSRPFPPLPWFIQCHRRTRSLLSVLTTLLSDPPPMLPSPLPSASPPPRRPRRCC